MTIFQLVSHNEISAIAGASAWSYEDPTSPSLIGFTDSRGTIDITATGRHKIRFMAYGHTPSDVDNTPRDRYLVKMVANHPGSFSGFLSNAQTAIWHNEASDMYFEFTAYGFYRSEKGYRSFLEEPLIQYRMPSSSSWNPLGPIAKKPTGGLGKLPPLPEHKWSYLFTRSDAFPTDDRYVSVIDPRDRRFRFPEPGIMLVNSSGNTETNDGQEYKLVS